MATSSNTSYPMGMFPNGTVWICEHASQFQRSKGVFFGDNPLNFTLPILFLQTSLVGFLSTFLQIILTPLGESSFFPQMLAGLILGPSVLGQIEFVRKWLFPPKSFYVSETIALFGSMMYMFLIGVRIDLKILLRTGKKAWAIGIFSFITPLIISTFGALILRKLLSPTRNLYKSLFYIAYFLTTGSFHVTSIHLADLKLLNSELGQLAISSSMVSGTVSTFWVAIMVAAGESEIKKHKKDPNYNLMSVAFVMMVVLIVCVLRPIMFWMIRKTPEGRPIKESYILSVFLMLLGTSLFSEVIGQHFMVGPIILGMVVPDGPPLGSALTERLDTLVSGVFLPLYFLYSGARFKFFLIDSRSFAVVQIVAFFSFCGKVVGIMLPSIYWKMPVNDAFCLGLLMSAQGITQVLYLQTALYLRLIDEESYCNGIVAILWLTGATTPIVKFLYDPSKRYLALNKRRTIEHATTDIELRLMAIIHNHENTPPIINLFEMSNPTIRNPICFYVLHLIQLKGRSTPLFIDHQPNNNNNNNTNNNPSHSTHSLTIINAFRSYEQQNSGNVVVNLYTSLSPYDTMHDEICMQVAEKRVCMLIIPFHKQWKPNGITESAHPIRALNRHLLRTAPCSVGVLIDRGTLSRNNPLICVIYYSVGIIFIEGPDDREALAYAMRMANHPNVRITLIRLMEPRKKHKNFINRDPDGDMLHKFKVDCIQIKRHDYREEIVKDSVEMINVVRSLEGCFDLVMVGRRHTNESSLFRGLTDWNEFPELGPVGDMLVASDSKFDGSVLVVQQQKRSGVNNHHDLNLDPGFNMKQETLTIVEVPRDQQRKPWPVV